MPSSPPPFSPSFTSSECEIVLNPSSFLRYITRASQFCAFAQGLAISGVDLCLFLQCEVSFSSDNLQVTRGNEDREDLAFLRQEWTVLTTLHPTTSSTKVPELLLAIPVQSL